MTATATPDAEGERGGPAVTGRAGSSWSRPGSAVADRARAWRSRFAAVVAGRAGSWRSRPGSAARSGARRWRSRAGRTRPSLTWAIIAGGGTAGHVLPAIAVGQALMARGHPSASIHFVGSERGIERRLVPEAGFAVTLLPGRGLARRMALDNVGAVIGLVRATVQGLVLVARRRPAVIVSVGGYASVPCVLASALLRVPLVVAEQNAVPGAANRLAARVARVVAVSFSGTPLNKAVRAKVVVTGNPVRPDVLAVERGPGHKVAARHALGMPATGHVVAAFGGSLGALRINQSVVGLATRWRDRSDVALYHIVGNRDWDAMAAAAPEVPPDGLWYRQVRYEDRMALVYAAADVVVCRAGASTVAELAVVGLPAVLVPLPGAPNDHQTANATALVTAGAARLVADHDATDSRLADELDALLGDATTLATMSRAAMSMAHRDAADAVAGLAEQVSRD